MERVGFGDEVAFAIAFRPELIFGRESQRSWGVGPYLEAGLRLEGRTELARYGERAMLLVGQLDLMQAAAIFAPVAL